MATPNSKKPAAKAKTAAKPAAKATTSETPKNTSAPDSPVNAADVSGTGAQQSAPDPAASTTETGKALSDDKVSPPAGGDSGEVKKAKYKAVTAINHDGKDYAAGDDIPLDEQHVKQLLDVGAIEAASK